jgi:hypothetical protein
MPPANASANVLRRAKSASGDHLAVPVSKGGKTHSIQVPGSVCSARAQVPVLGGFREVRRVVRWTQIRPLGRLLRSRTSMGFENL